MHGWIILDKPLGLGSTQGVSAVKRALRDGKYGKFKVGHGGTLDPLATGVLPVAIGEATKLAGRMLDSDKVYDFEVTFGVETDTLDREGKPVATSEVRPALAQVEAVLPRFTGPIEQVPPAYSALKVDGERAYDLARAGEEVKLASRSVVIHDLQILPGTGRGTAGEAGGGGGVPRAIPDEERPRHQPAAGPPPRAGEDLWWHDAFAGRVRADPAAAGDVVLARKDAPASYHLAVTVDDAAQGITHVVRGVDLFAATHVHRLLQALLGLPTPEYRHHPLLMGPDGTRLAKRHGAPSLEALRLAGEDGPALAARLRAGQLPVGIAAAQA
jgi:tRNA pseudouridine(55) synthase